jgi:hypothetical protein
VTILGTVVRARRSPVRGYDRCLIAGQSGKVIAL